MDWSAVRRALGMAGGLMLPVVAATGSAQAPLDRPTFNRDVAPILFQRCVGCHRPGEAAPMSLLTYRDARPWARAIRAQVAARDMPPWPANPVFSRPLANDARLSTGEIDTILAWADAGAPEGDGAP